MIPPWIVDDMAAVLTPPAHVRALGNTRSAQNYLDAIRSLHVLEAPRYQPHTNGTRCNLLVSDGAAILSAPLPHRHDLIPGKPQWMSANDMINALRTNRYAGWSRVESAKLGTLAPPERAAQGLPTIATWFNPGKHPDGTPASGHVVFVVPTPAGHSGIYVTGAGRTCVQECPIAQAFGEHVNEVEFWGHP